MNISRKHILSCFLLLCSCLCAIGQQSKIDSLLTLLKNDKEDSTKVIRGNKLAREYINADSFDFALQFGNSSLLLARQLNFKKGIATSLGNIGIVYFNRAEYPKALDYYLKALKIDEELHDNTGAAKRRSNVGIIYYQQGDYEKALDYYFKALKTFEELGDKSRMSVILGNIGVSYKEQADNTKTNSDKRKQLFVKALEFYLKALKIDEEMENEIGVAANVGNIGIIYYEQANEPGQTAGARDSLYKKAINYYLKVLKMVEEQGDKTRTAIWLGNLGSLYSTLKKYKEAYPCLYRALSIDDSIGTSDGVKFRYEALSTLYEKSNISLPDTIGGKLLSMEQMRLRALYYHKRYITVRDTLYSEENKKQLVRKEMNFEFEKKESAAKAEQDKKDAVAIADKRRQNFVLLLVSFVLLLVAVVAFIIFRSLRITRKQKKLIEKQKQAVEEHQKEILDSIYYARRIQRSLLTSEKYIAKSLFRLMKN